MNDPFKEKTMKCPACPESALVMTDRQGLEIDYCPSCRGVWLDRGELDKLIVLAKSGRSISLVLAPKGEDHPWRDDEE